VLENGSVMGRIRTIKPEFPQSESMGRVSREARLCFILLWTLVDDSGRTRGSSRMLASLLYPYDDDAPSLIDRWLTELERENCLKRYEIDSNCYLQICKWNTHQKIDHPSPSRLPEPRESSRMLAPDLVPSTIVPVPKPSTKGSSPDTPPAVLTPLELTPVKNKTVKEFILPDWIPQQLWDDFVENRKANKSPMTDKAKNIAVKKLDGFRQEGYDIVAIIEETILNNWKSIFVNANTPKIPKPKKEWRPSTQRELDEQNYKDFGSPPPEEWAPEGAPQGWLPCRN
jgi:hypothetical protein